MRSDRNNTPLVADILQSITNKVSLEIFDIVAIKKKIDSKKLRYLGGFKELTNKPYYSSVQELTKLGIIKRTGGVFSLTSFGVVVYHAKSRIDTAIKEYWKLKAVDSIEGSKEIDQYVRGELINNIIIDDNIRRVLLD